MKKTKLTRSLLAACSIVALSAVMYGCAHDGGDDDRADTGMETPMPVAVDLSGIAADAMVEAGTADIAAGMSADIGEITFSCAAGGDDCSVTVDANGNAMATGGTVTAANSAAYTLRKEEEETERLAAVAAATKEAKTKLDAITAEGAQTTDAGLGGAGVTFGTADGNYDYTIERDRMATTVKVTAHGATDAADDVFEPSEMDVGYGNSMHTLTHDEDTDGNVVTEIAFISTDIKTPRAVDFAKWQNAAGATPQALDVMADDGAAPAGDEVADALDVGNGLNATDDAQAAILKLVMAAQFAAPGTGSSSVVHTFLPAVADADPDTPGAQPRAAAMVAGTYNGSMGTYICAGTANCTATVDDKGAVTAMTDGWVFVPAEDVKTYQPDYDYLSWGFWLKKTTDSEGVTEYNEVETFAMATGMTDTAGNVTGMASYSGGATGVYVHNVLSSGGGTVESRTAGHFTADASLMAYFGQPASPNDNIPPSKLNSVTGTINNFTLSGGEAQDWSVALQSTADINFAGTNDVTGTANGGGTAGTFAADFYGEAAMVPGAVTGEFNANFSNGSVAGAFGATKDD